ARAESLGDLRNTASVATPTPLATVARTLASATTKITPGPHSRILLDDTASPPTIPSGATATYMPKVTNPNPWPLHNVKVCDRLPARTMFVSASRGSKRGGRVVCWTVGTLAPHTSKSFSLRAETLLGVTGKLRDAATAKATVGGKHLTAPAHAHVLVVPTGLCGTASSLDLHGPNNPLAVAAC